MKPSAAMYLVLIVPFLLLAPRITQGEPGSYLSENYKASLVAKYLETDPARLLDLHLEATVVSDDLRDEIRSLLESEEARENFVARIDAAEEWYWLQVLCYTGLQGSGPRGSPSVRNVMPLSPPWYTRDVFHRLGPIARGDRELPLRTSALDNETFELALRGMKEELDDEERDHLRDIVTDFYTEENCDRHEDFELLYAAYINQTNDLGILENGAGSESGFVECHDIRYRAMFSIMSGLHHDNEPGLALILRWAGGFAHDPGYNGIGAEHDAAKILPLLYGFRSERDVVNFVLRGVLLNRERGQGRFSVASTGLLMILRDSDAGAFVGVGQTPIQQAERGLRIRGLQIKDEYLSRPEGLRYPAPE